MGGGRSRSLLQMRTVEYARAHGIRGFTADVLSDNAAMLAVFRRSGGRVKSRVIDGVIELQLLSDEPMEVFAPGGAAPLGVANTAIEHLANWCEGASRTRRPSLSADSTARVPFRLGAHDDKTLREYGVRARA